MNHQHIILGILLSMAFAVLSPTMAAADTPSPQQDSSVSPHGQNLSTLSNPNLSPCGADCTSATRRPAGARILSFSEMWTLINKYRRAHNSHFSPELIASIFWEESGFRMVEHPQSRAVGFGQVLPSNLPGINRRFQKNFTKADLLTSPEASVEASILALEMAWEWKRDKVGALHAYAGGDRNKHVVRKWLAAEAAFIPAHVPYADLVGMDWLVRLRVVNALRLCSQPGFDPQILFAEF